LADLREQLQVETNRAQHVEKCLRETQQQLSDANDHVATLVCRAFSRRQTINKVGQLFGRGLVSKENR